MELANGRHRENPFPVAFGFRGSRNRRDDHIVLLRWVVRLAAVDDRGRRCRRRIFLTEWSSMVISFWRLMVVAAFAFAEPGFAQKLVDPNVVAPEYRAAAEKRRAEQITIMDCHRKAEAAKVLARDRAEHIN